MVEKVPSGNQVSPIAVGLQPAQSRDVPHIHGGARPGAGRKPGVPNKTTTTFRDLITQAATEVDPFGAILC
jgi:hypothetical protein